MIVKPFNVESHYTTLVSILTKYNIQAPSPDSIPELGVMVYQDDNECVAIGFLRQCEGGTMAMYDGLTSNPDCFPEERDKALDLVTLALLEIAKTRKIEQILAFTKDNNTLVRSVRLGFVKHSTHSVMTFDLKGRA